MILVFIKIIILSFLYGFIIKTILRRKTDLKIINKRYIIPLIFVGLLIWRNSYWRNNGYGDYGRVPLTSEYEITMVDFSYVDLLKNGKKIENGFKELYIENKILYAKMENSYLIFDTKTGESYSFYVEQFIKNGGKVEKLMNPSNFHSNYWGWKLFFT